jgi:hypothetical protein
VRWLARLAEDLAVSSMSSNRAYGGARLREPRCAIAHRGMAAIMFDRGDLTQKPAAHFCGRVLSNAIHFEQNTMFHWTSQTEIEVFFHSVQKIESPSGWVTPRPCT